MCSLENSKNDDRSWTDARLDPRARLEARLPGSAVVLWLVAILFAGALSLLYTGFGRAVSSTPGSSDFYKFYLSGERLASGRSMYWSAPRTTLPTDPCYHGGRLDLGRASKMASELSAAELQECLHPNLNPPFFAALTLPLARLEYQTAWRAWSLGSMFAAIAAIILLARAGVLRHKGTALGVVLLVVGLFAYFPTFVNFAYGQVATFLLALLALGWLALRRGDDVAAGVWIGLAASIKPFVGLFLVVLFMSRNWRACASLVAVGAIALLIGGLVTGFTAYLEYLSTLKNVEWLAASWNASFAGFFSRILGGSENTPWLDAPGVARTLTTACSFLTLAVIYHLVKRCSHRGRTVQADVIFAATIPAMLLLSPLGWLYYFPLLLITVLVVWEWTAALPNGRVYRMVLGLGVACTFVPRPMVPSAEMNDATAWFWDAGMYFYALVVTFLVVWRSAVAVRPPDEAT